VIQYGMLSKKPQGTSTTHVTTIAGHRLHYRMLGVEDGPPLVLIHGFGTSGHIWHYVQPYLGQCYRLYIVDLPGFGRSKLAGPWRSWRLQEIAPLLAQWLCALGISSAAVMGHSMGGAVAIQLATCAPEIVKQLILVNTVGLPLQTHLPAMAARSAHSFLQRGNGGYPLPLVRDVLRPRFRLLLQSAQETVRSDFRQHLAQITIPTLIIWGERDVLLPIALGRNLSAALPHAQFVTLPGCGHRPMLAQPAEFSRIVLDFLHE